MSNSGSSMCSRHRVSIRSATFTGNQSTTRRALNCSTLYPPIWCVFWLPPTSLPAWHGRDVSARSHLGHRQGGCHTTLDTVYPSASASLIAASAVGHVLSFTLAKRGPNCTAILTCSSDGTPPSSVVQASSTGTSPTNEYVPDGFLIRCKPYMFDPPPTLDFPPASQCA